MKEINILWFKRDLRIVDNEALNEASKKYNILPIYIIEKDLWSQNSHSNSQWQFCKECLLNLSRDLEKIGQPLIIRNGNVIEIFEEIRNNFIIKGIFSHQETGDLYSYKRDQRVRKWAKRNNILWNEYLQFAVFRGSFNRNDWTKLWKKHFDREIFEKPIKISPININKGKIPSDAFFDFKEIACKGRLKGGREEALKRLKYFLNEKINSYSIDISNPEKSFNSCSRLSPYISWGCISLKEIFNQTKTSRGKGIKMLKSRLTWHCHFIQKLESEPEIEFKEFHPFFSGIRIKNDFRLERWSEGKTGFPFLDACMRSLNYYGWINFRMRAMLMSFASYNLWIPWQLSGTKLATKFVDYEPGIHWSQCQMQSGTTSINTIRIYNPIKQGKEYDPNGNFIRKWVPELKNIPEVFIHEPWLINNKEKVIKSINYFQPIVDLQESSRYARKHLYEISRKKCYWDISNKIYLKHGSRKTNKKKVKDINSKNKNTLPFEKQLSFNLKKYTSN